LSTKSTITQISDRSLTQAWQGRADLPEILQRIYCSRGVCTDKEIEYLLKNLLSFSNLSSINEASCLLYEALSSNQRMVILGDFDADGATSTALAVLALRAMGAQNVSYCLPNRFEYGYGLSPEIVPLLLQKSPDLVITVDNGISSIRGVQMLQDRGIKVLVTDHHLPGEELPAADVIVNPNCVGDAFASKNLAGVGVIFYVMCALRRHALDHQWFATHNIEPPNMGQFLDLVALGTVADVVPLDYNNRILVHQGLQRMRAGTARPGIAALLRIAGRNPEKLSAADLGFAVGPRLNAAGRLEDMSLGVACLLSQDESAAMPLAEQLDQLNKERRNIEHDMQAEASRILRELDLSQAGDCTICLYDESWHQGVVGLLASRIKEQYYRPVIVFARGEQGLLKGSGRSIKGINIRDTLADVAAYHPELIEKFGGHAMAAGLSIKTDHLSAFQKAWQQAVKSALGQQSLQRILETDGVLSPDQLTLKTAQLLARAGPWGQAFPQPSFRGEFVILGQKLVAEKHLKMTLQLSDVVVDAICFNVDLKSWPNHHCDRALLVYQLDVNEYGGHVRLQLLVDHLEAVTELSHA
jgi:single-stranded-DNA-specific exonuclease